MGINGVNQQNYNYYNRGVNNNFTLTNSYANAPIFTGVNKTNIDSFQNSQAVVSKDGKDDGSIGFVGAVGNLFKGVGNFFKGMVCDENGKFSIGRTLTTLGIGAAIGIACTMLPAITIAGTAFSTLGLISTGFLGFAGLHAGSAAIDIMSAKTDAEAEQAWQSMGSALTEGGLAYLGYRASGGIFAKDIVPTTPSGSTPKIPKTEPLEPQKTPTPKIEPMNEPAKVEIVNNSSTNPHIVSEEPVVQEYLYHFTSENCYNSMLQEGKIKMSKDEFSSELNGIFMVDLPNFMQKWNNVSGIFDETVDIGVMLFGQASKKTGNIICLRIPTKNLDLSKVKIRSQKDLFKSLFNRGASKEEISRASTGDLITSRNTYHQHNEPIEYIVGQEIPMNQVEYVGKVNTKWIEEDLEPIEYKRHFSSSMQELFKGQIEESSIFF